MAREVGSGTGATGWDASDLTINGGVQANRTACGAIERRLLLASQRCTPLKLFAFAVLAVNRPLPLVVANLLGDKLSFPVIALVIAIDYYAFVPIANGKGKTKVTGLFDLVLGRVEVRKWVDQNVLTKLGGSITP